MRTRLDLAAVFALALSVAVPMSASEADNGTGFSTPPVVGTHGTAVTRSDPWVALPACLHGVSRPAGAVVGDRFYVIGGEPRDGYIQEYDPVSMMWDDTNALMPTPASNLCAAVIGADIYVPGGYTGVLYLDTLQVYHTATDTWETLAGDPMPVGLSGPACASHEGKLYVVGGSAGGIYTDATYIYDPAAATGSRWTTGAAAPETGAYGDAIMADGYLFYAGMRNATTDSAGVYRYDPVADSWTTMPPLTTARGGARMWTYEGKLAVGGGGWLSYLTSVEEYDLSTGTGGAWTPGNSLVSGSRTFAAAQDDANGVLYKGAGWAAAFQVDAESSDFVSPVGQIETVEVTAFGVVEFNQITAPPLGDVNPGDQVVMTFLLDPDVFIDSTTYPTRGYVIDPASFVLTLGTTVMSLQDPFPPGLTPYFVLRDNDPVVDGFFVATSVDFPVGVPINQTGVFDQFAANYSVTYGGDALVSLDILDALGIYNFTGLTVFHWTVDDGPMEPLGIIFRDMRISEETLFADGFESGDTGSWSDVAP